MKYIKTLYSSEVKIPMALQEKTTGGPRLTIIRLETIESYLKKGQI